MDLQVLEHGPVLELRFNRPDKKNAITGAMYLAMAEAMGRPGHRVLLFSATGDIFTAGNDIKDFLAMRELVDTPPSQFIHALATANRPMIAAVQGAAIGVGTTMLLHCDLVYAAPAATFSTPFVNLGLVPEAGSSILLPARIGVARASAMLLLGEAMNAADALQAGLLNEIVPAEALHAHALGVAHRLARQPSAAVTASRALIRQGREALYAQMRLEQAAFGAALAGPEAKEAFAAFLERRLPVFA